jgi:hypothetical protein
MLTMLNGYLGAKVTAPKDGATTPDKFASSEVLFLAPTA